MKDSGAQHFPRPTRPVVFIIRAVHIGVRFSRSHKSHLDSAHRSTRGMRQCLIQRIPPSHSHCFNELAAPLPVSLPMYALQLNIFTTALKTV